MGAYMKYELIEAEALKFVLIDGDIYLVDTGSPFSYSKKGEILIDGRSFKNSRFQDVLKERMDDLSVLLKEQLKKDIMGVIGVDIISVLGLTINKMEKIVSFESKDLEKAYTFSITVKEIHNQKYIVFPKLSLSGMTYEGECSFILDTGACVSIFKKGLCNHAQYAYRRDYYYPSLGRTLTSDFMFFKLKEENELKVIAGSNTDMDIKGQFEFLGVDGELCFNDFDWNFLVIDIKKNVIAFN